MVKTVTKAKAKAKAKDEVPPKGKAVATTQPPARAAASLKKGHDKPPAALAKRMKAESGRGVSTAQEDNLVPLIYVLQPLSPQVIKQDARYMEGAEAGMIWLRNLPDPFVPGDEGILFQPVFFSKSWNEWIPRDDGGGFVARHDELPEVAEKVELEDEDGGRGRIVYRMPNGNEVIETRNHVGLVHGVGPQPLPFVLGLTSTGHTFGRQWMFMMNQKVLEDGTKAPSYAGLYRITTKFKQNKKGSWFTWDVEDAGWVDEDSYNAGSALYDAFASGAKEIETPDEGSVGE